MQFTVEASKGRRSQNTRCTEKNGLRPTLGAGSQPASQMHTTDPLSGPRKRGKSSVTSNSSSLPIKMLISCQEIAQTILHSHCLDSESLIQPTPPAYNLTNPNLQRPLKKIQNFTSLQLLFSHRAQRAQQVEAPAGKSNGPSWIPEAHMVKEES